MVSAAEQVCEIFRFHECLNAVDWNAESSGVTSASNKWRLNWVNIEVRDAYVISGLYQLQLAAWI